MYIVVVFFFSCAASDKQTLLSNDQLYQVRECGMKETLLDNSGKISEWERWASYLVVIIMTQNCLGHTR